MRTSLLIIFAILPFTTWSQQRFERKGFIFGAAAGVSTIRQHSDLIGDDHQAGLTFPNFKIGMMVGRRTALALLLPGSVYEYRWGERTRERAFEGFFPAIQYWPANRWWVLAGAGAGMDAPVFYDIKAETERKFYFGPAVVAGTGYELWRRGKFAFDVQGRVQAGAINAPEGRRSAVAFSLVFGVNWY